jgi:general secretion pathway protein N
VNNKVTAALGLLLGAVVALVVFAPASWLAAGVASASGQRVQLADARGTVWRGSGVLVLTGGADSLDASALPGRLQWTMAVEAWGLALRASHACCINGQALVRVLPGLSRTRFELGPSQAGFVPASPASSANPALQLGQWPASWLAGLGTPWNTLKLSGLMRLSTPGLSFESVQGRWVFTGRAELALDDMASRLSTLDVLGSYTLSLQGDAKGDTATVQLATRQGALQLNGSGEWAAAKFRFAGQAGAQAGFEAPLNNLLNIIGRRQGAVSLISIG